MIPGVSMDVVNFENDSGNYAVTVIGAATATTIADSITTTGGSESHPTNQAECHEHWRSTLPRMSPSVGRNPLTTFIDSQTVVPGSSAVTVSGQTISLASSGGDIFVNGQSTRLLAVDGVSPGGALSLDSLVLEYTAGSPGQLISGSQTLTAGEVPLLSVVR
ncbi:hypothetical protein LTS18_007216 [Coniosporium uncinatum]|uniref:Uncharacterized protein n=1 Tax=Coniosporium uncinatum TaxID=93489 RepID=A0ACC3DYX5_9PEZI|nr:hypothetical protein LTS18_007216 [Coniosporium uncinatum]